jgi:hypothetical protein
MESASLRLRYENLAQALSTTAPEPIVNGYWNMILQEIFPCSEDYIIKPEAPCLTEANGLIDLLITRQYARTDESGDHSVLWSPWILIYEGGDLNQSWDTVSQLPLSLLNLHPLVLT